MSVKERLHRMVDELSGQEAETLLRRLEALPGDQFLRYLDAAPVDDESVTADEEAAISEVEADRAAGSGPRRTSGRTKPIQPDVCRR